MIKSKYDINEYTRKKNAMINSDDVKVRHGPFHSHSRNSTILRLPKNPYSVQAHKTQPNQATHHR